MPRIPLLLISLLPLSSMARTWGPPVPISNSINEIKDTAIADFNGDGHQDIVSHGLETVVWQNMGKGKRFIRHEWARPMPAEGASLDPYTHLLHDFDHDGIPDLLVLTPTSQPLGRLAAIHFGNKNFGFGPRIMDLGSLAISTEMMAIDLNGDGFDDLCGRSSALILRKDQAPELKTGGQRLPVDFFSTARKYRALADMDGDGLKDAIYCPDQNRVNYCRSLGDGRFEPPFVISSATEISSHGALAGIAGLEAEEGLPEGLAIITSSLTPDGKTSLRIGIRLAYRGPGFTEVAATPVLISPTLRDSYNLNGIGSGGAPGDLFLSLGVGSPGSPNDSSGPGRVVGYKVSLAEGSTGISKSSEVAHAGRAPFPVAGDLTGDRKPDLVLVHNSGTITWHAGTKNKKLSARSNPLTDQGFVDRLVLAEDLDGDGAPDLITQEGGMPSKPTLDGLQVCCWWNDGSGTSFKRQVLVDGAEIATVLRNQGKPSLLLKFAERKPRNGGIEEIGTKLIRLDFKKKRRFSQKTILRETQGAIAGLDTADWNGDGYDDIWEWRSEYAKLFTILSSGKAKRYKPVLTLDSYTVPVDPDDFFRYNKPVDMDADGDLDLLWERAWVKNDGPAGFQPGGELDRNYFPIGADIDGDGFEDLFYKTFGSNPAETVVKLVRPGLLYQESIAETDVISFSDLDGDGDTDLLMGRGTPNRPWGRSLVWRENLGAGEFAIAHEVAPGLPYPRTSSLTADMNRDGIPDLIVLSNSQFRRIELLLGSAD